MRAARAARPRLAFRRRSFAFVGVAMTVARIASRAQLGLHAPLVHVEVHVSAGLPVFQIVGLAATAVEERKGRVRAALINCGFEFPAGRITVNLAPADIPKEGGRFDLPIALGLILASGQIAKQEDELANLEFYGEIALGGELKPVKALLLAAAHAAESGHDLIVPQANLNEVLIAARGAVYGATHLKEVCQHIQKTQLLTRATARTRTDTAESARDDALDLLDVRGQLQAKRA